MPFNGAYDDTKAANRVTVVGGSANIGFVTINGNTGGGVQALYFPTPPTLTSGASTSLYTDVNGSLHVREQYAPGYEDNTNNVAKVEFRNAYSFVSQASIQVKSGANFLHGLLISSISTPSLTVADSITGTTPIIATFPAGVPVNFYPLNSTVATGITLSCSPGTLPQITVVTRS